MRVLVVDIGGSRVKLHMDSDFSAAFDSGKTLTPISFMQQVRQQIDGLAFDAVSVGYPGAVGPEGPLREAGNLGPGWVGFDFEDAFERPVRVANDAVLQALGNYERGRMLFLGLGTGLGSTLVAERVIMPLELGSLAFDRHGTMADHVGAAGLETHGTDAWAAKVLDIVEVLRRAVLADEVVLGGGNAKRLTTLPSRARLGHERAAFVGGARLWEHTVEPHDRPPSNAWRILQ
jgi:predicted NBD/HSP70 family sugar kinase